MSTTAKTPTAAERDEGTALPGEQERDEQPLGEIAKAAEGRSHGLVETARKANAVVEKALSELAASPLMVNGTGKAAREAHKAAKEQETRLQNLLPMLHEHFNPRTPEEG